ncbi:MAG TPA: chorismate mutase [Syntrophomonadaceae bacterium]|nr:chorismate mutase [Syntrophomonadaceae bacterium]
MTVRGIRGAITIEADTASNVLEAVTLLLQTINTENDLVADDISSILFTATRDIKSIYPARAARDLGWDKVPLLCFQEMDVTNSLPMCIRVLVNINTSKTNDQIKHVYLRKAVALRPDICKNQL